MVNSAFHPCGVGKSRTGACLTELRRDAFICVRWQVTLCDLIRHVTKWASHKKLYATFNV